MSDSNSHDLRWYIVQTKPTAEDQVCKRWAQVGYEVFFPRIKRAVRGARRHQTRVSPLFPSYLFVRLDLDDVYVYRAVRYTRGVRRVLGGPDKPIPVDASIIDVIRERVNGDGVLEQQMTYKKGDTVRIKWGYLADLIGVLEKPVSAAGRVRVLLEVYHKRIRAELSCAEIERI